MNSLNSNAVRGQSALLLTPLLLEVKVIFLIVTLVATSYSVSAPCEVSAYICSLMSTADFYHDH